MKFLCQTQKALFLTTILILWILAFSSFSPSVVGKVTWYLLKQHLSLGNPNHSWQQTRSPFVLVRDINFIICCCLDTKPCPTLCDFIDCSPLDYFVRHVQMQENDEKNVSWQGGRLYLNWQGSFKIYNCEVFSLVYDCPHVFIHVSAFHSFPTTALASWIGHLIDTAILTVMIRCSAWFSAMSASS